MLQTRNIFPLQCHILRNLSSHFTSKSPTKNTTTVAQQMDVPVPHIKILNITRSLTLDQTDI